VSFAVVFSDAEHAKRFTHDAVSLGAHTKTSPKTPERVDVTHFAIAQREPEILELAKKLGGTIESDVAERRASEPPPSRRHVSESPKSHR
jgi:hypothetical protein